MVFKNLSPLIKSPSEIHYCALSDLNQLIPVNPYQKPEKEVIAEFDSKKKIPQLIFLGIDETEKNGYKFKRYTGAPHFAFDITPDPEGDWVKETEGVIKSLMDKGLSFVEGMRAMSFPADVGKCSARADR